MNRANLRDLIAAADLVILLKLDSNRRFFSPCDLEIRWMTSKNYRDHLYITSSFVHHLKPFGEFKLVLLSGNARFGSQSAIFVASDLQIWWMTFKNNRAHFLCYIKLFASFQSHRWIHTRATVPKRSIRVNISDLLSRVTLKFDGWYWKTIGHLFYVASSVMHHLIAIGELKLMLQSENPQFGSKSAIFCHVWPCNLTDDLEKH